MKKQVVVLVPPLAKSDRTLCAGGLGFLAPEKRKASFVFSSLTY